MGVTQGVGRFAAIAATSSASAQSCAGNPVAVQIFLARLFDEKTGAFQVLGSTPGAEEPGVERPRIEASVVDVSKTEPRLAAFAPVKNRILRANGAYRAA